jgi:pilus assembly protein CpaF
MNLIASFQAPNDENRTIYLKGNQAIIGRDETADIRLEHPCVSRKHAVVTIIEGKNHFNLEDCGSANGTLIDGISLTQGGILYPDQSIEIGPFRFRLCCMPEPGRDPESAATDDQHHRRFEEQVIQEAVKRLPSIIGSADPLKQQAYTNNLNIEVEKALYRNILEMLPEDTSAVQAEQLTKRALTLSMGLGPLEDWLNDSDISEIMINGTKTVYLEINGNLKRIDSPFSEDDSIMRIVDRILFPLGRRVDEKTPYVDGRLPDGSRINVVIPPASLEGPVVTIRKFSAEKLSIPMLINKGSISNEGSKFLELAIRKKRNILISGGTGTGKTTLLNALAFFIDPSERIVTIEDAAELNLQQNHVIRLETRSPNIEGQGEVTTRDLVKNSLRMRPDRIVVGECRGQEAFDMLQAMNTGHEGSMTTCHANSPRDALKRIEAMALMTGLDISQRVIRELVGSAIHIIVQLTRLKGGKRAVTSIVEVDGFESDQILTQKIFEYCTLGSQLRATGLQPSFLRESEFFNEPQNRTHKAN